MITHDNSLKASIKKSNHMFLEEPKKDIPNPKDIEGKKFSMYLRQLIKERKRSNQNKNKIK